MKPKNNIMENKFKKSIIFVVYCIRSCVYEAGFETKIRRHVIKRKEKCTKTIKILFLYFA